MSSVLENIGTIAGAALAVLSPHIWKAAKSFVKHRSDYLSKNIKIRQQINEIVNEIRIRHGANRSMILEFSNTEKSTGGFPFEFGTITYEKTDSNVVAIKEQIQKMPIGNMLDWLSPLAESERYRFFQLDDPVNPDAVHFRMIELQVATIIFFKITSSIKDGVIALHYLQPYDEDWQEEYNECLQDMKFQANRIYQLMKTLKK
jgi:hypothetical protein